MVKRRNVLEALTRRRLSEVAESLGITGLSGKTKDGIIEAIAAKRAVKTGDLLNLFRLEELKALCRKAQLDDGGRSKANLVARLLNTEVGNRTMAKKAKKKENGGKRLIEQYDHKGKTRANNPPVGLVTAKADPDEGKKSYQYDPHLDPQLQWAGKAERLCFEVPTVSLHVHERIDPKTIVRAVQKRNGDSGKSAASKPIQRSLFEEPEENPPLREAVDFYKHAHGWSNRLIAGDSLVVMNSLLEKEGMASKVQMVYIDPPYGIKYKSNFQPFVNKKKLSDSDQDEDLTSEPEMIKAFRDTWELGLHSYLSYLRDRLTLAKELLHESGSVFVQISGDNLHHVREILDEIFDVENFIGQIAFQKKGSQSGDFVPPICEYLVWYGKTKDLTKFHALFVPRDLTGIGGSGFDHVELVDGSIRKLTDEEAEGKVELPNGVRPFAANPLFSDKPGPNEPVQIEGKMFPSGGNSWKVSPKHIPKIYAMGRIIVQKSRLRFKRYAEDFNFVPYTNIWTGLGGASGKIYVVQTNIEVVKRCMLMTTDPGDIVFDPTCGSGTTAYVAEQWGRRWISCDTSRVATTLAKQRLMTALFDYYELAQPSEGIGNGFKYKTVPHITLKSIANDEPPGEEAFYDQPIADKSRVRVTGPFTLEAVPAPAVRPVMEIVVDKKIANLDDQTLLPGVDRLDDQTTLEFTEDVSVTRFGETLRQRQWRDELAAAGIRGKGGQRVEFSRLEPLRGTRWLQCEGDTKGERRERVVISFGPEHAPMEQRQVEMALEEAGQLKPAPQVVVFAAFQFDPEAAKDIDETRWPGVTLLKAQMNTDLLTDDLKKNRSSNESYWLMGQPDVEVREIKKGDHKGKYEIQVHGFDYYNTRTGSIESGDTTKIAMWMLDTDYDGRSLFPHQVFFPLAGPKDGWARLAKNLKAEIDEDLIEAYRGTVSLPFEPGDFKRAAVKIVDDRGIESLKIVEIR